MEFCFLFNLEMIQYLYLPPHVFRLVVTIHCCKTAFVLYGFTSVPSLSHIGKCLSVFSKNRSF